MSTPRPPGGRPIAACEARGCGAAARSERCQALANGETRQLDAVVDGELAHQVLGVLTEQDSQLIFVDTPGLHANAERAINRHMNRAALSALQDVDIILMMI